MQLINQQLTVEKLDWSTLRWHEKLRHALDSKVTK